MAYNLQHGWIGLRSVAIIGGVFYRALEFGQLLLACAQALALAVGCIVAVLIVGGAPSVLVAKESHSSGSKS